MLYADLEPSEAILPEVQLRPTTLSPGAELDVSAEHDDGLLQSGAESDLHPDQSTWVFN
jgi:hypothetical protein